MTFATGPFVSGPFGVGPFASGAFGNKWEDRPDLNLPFSSLADATGSDGRAAGWWNLFRGGNNVDEYIDASTGALTYGPHNRCRNGEAVGAVVSGALPNLWAVAQTPPGCAFSIVAVGSGYVDIRLSGTPSNSQKGLMAFETTSFTVGEPVYFAIDAQFIGTPVGCPYIYISGGGLFGTTLHVATTAKTKLSCSGVTTGTQVPWIFFEHTSGVPIDVTVRLSAGQINTGLVPTAYVPTTSAAIYSLNPRITYSRGSLGTRIGPSGNVEYGPHNLIAGSEDFGNASWLKVNATATTATQTGPDGLQSAGVVTATATGYAFVYRGSSGATNAPAVVSFVVKQGTAPFAILNLSSDIDRNCWFNFSTGLFETVHASCTTSVVALANGFYRISASVANTPTSPFNVIGPASANNSTSATAGTTVIVARAQVNVGSLLPYVPTGANAYYGPRITYDPVTLANLGFLVEGQAVQLAPFTEDFSNAAWTKTRATISSNAAVAPNGTTTADTLIEDTTANNTHFVEYSLSKAASAIQYALSVFVKPASGSRRFLVIFTDSGTANGAYAGFDLAGVAVGIAPTTFGAAWTAGTATISPVANGFYRVSFVATTSTDTTFRIAYRLDNGTGSGALSQTYTGDGVSGVHIWGAQLEASAAATSYIPNPTSGTMTRLADSASMTGTDFSSWFNSAQGTFAFTARIPAGDGYLFSVSDNTANNRISVRKSSGNLIYEVLSGGATQASISVAAPTVGTTAKIAVSFISNLFSFAVNGAAGTDDTAGTVPTVSRLTIGSDHTPANHWNESAALTRYFRTALTAAKLQALTR